MTTLPHTLNIFDYPARFQFGEANAPCGGSSCCTDTAIKMIVEYYKEASYSLSYIRSKAEEGLSFNEGACTGINHVEVLNALNRLGVTHYKVGYGSTWADVSTYLDIGPVIVGVHYGSYPKHVNGRCGTTNRAEAGGKTDCPFTGAHAVLVIGKNQHMVNGVTHKDFFIRDPDHNSPARPEKPNYDRITAGQLNTAMVNLPKYTAFTNTYAIYPTQKKVLPVVVTPKIVACDDVNLRTSPNLGPIKVKLDTGSIVATVGTVSGSRWVVQCPTSKAGSSWYKITHVHGVPVSSKYGVPYLYAATGLFK